jgi:hypothetical protein
MYVLARARVCSIISKVGIIINKSYNGYTRANDGIYDVYNIIYYNIPSHKNRYLAAAAELPIQS